jgi:hypothetical protein
MRFTSTNTQTNRSSKKLRIDQREPSTNNSSAKPEQSFPGHQELDLYDYIAKTQMLAKFLGMLDFSPNWDIAADSIADIGEYTKISAIKVKKCIELAWAQHRLVVVVPWVVQYLEMMKWYASGLFQFL